MRPIALLSALMILPCIAHADLSSFTTGPLIEGYGPVADIGVTLPVPEDAVFRHSFDLAERAGDGELNSTLVAAARFINLHARAGVDAASIDVALSLIHI